MMSKLHPTFKIANRDLFPRRYFEEIGILVVQANFLEDFLRQAIIDLVNAKPDDGDIAVSGMNLRTMVKVLRTLIHHKFPNQWQRYDKLSKHIERAIDFRNSVAHSVVASVTIRKQSSLKSIRKRVRARKGVVKLMEFEDLSIHKIRRRALYIFRTFMALDCFLKDNNITRPYTQ
ncbi:MAG: hypothetical protein HQ514_05005 [Rhodospirillales bacterium]|nr:hypothetical protein [Rhodospirillales bacterium]